MMALVESGGLRIGGNDDALKAPWWLTRVVQVWTRIKNVREAGAYDVDKLTAPKEYWLSTTKLDDWFAEREGLRQTRAEGVLPD